MPPSEHADLSTRKTSESPFSKKNNKSYKVTILPALSLETESYEAEYLHP